MNLRSSLITTIALGVSVCMVTAASAASFTADSISLAPGPKVTADVDGRDVYLEPQVLTDSHGNSIRVFCIDPSGTDVLGTQSPAIQYNASSDLAQLGLTSIQAGEIQWLDNYSVGKTDEFDDAIQGAMAEVKGSSVTNISDSVVADDLSTLMANLETASFQSGLIPTNMPSAQIVVPPPSAVPEPASWALMLVGFGGMGVAIRSRRRAIPALA
jgi:hypothetical protein